MKKLSLFTCILLSITSLTGFSQVTEDTFRINKRDIIWVEQQESGLVSKAYLYALTDSSLTLTSVPLYPAPASRQITIQASEIEKIKIRKGRAVGNGILIGGLTGFGIGGGVGLMLGDTQESWLSMSATSKGLLLGFINSVPGVIIGGLVGAVSKKNIRIRGEAQAFQKALPKLRKCLLKPE